MKLPNLFFKYWDNSETEADMPKLGIDWWSRKWDTSSSWFGFGIDFIFFGRRLDITFTNDSQAYAKDMEEWMGEPLLPFRPSSAK
jgi:hypothetical protein